MEDSLVMDAPMEVDMDVEGRQVAIDPTLVVDDVDTLGVDA